ncbi:GtrA family protein [Vibrio diazotrophicus]|uniref:GtrA family protein n=1 Tax=Vibrio diazotrophicus TaxID=685 RepID=UPI0022AF039D|nr:GtrA family protein [Vibrio diazotrophicus]MCZ4372670.1 GtrA family protein [Vibrio diazotrophicus]
MTKPILYVVFALIATFVNLIAQEITSRLFHHQYEIIVSMFIGTLAGLIVKYLLDKRYIFQFTPSSQKTDIITFFFYSVMGVITTLLFWVTEYTFDIWFETKIMRYLGAVIGLSVGYITKYHLDKKYVFIER